MSTAPTEPPVAGPVAGAVKTEYSPNARAKCQLCRIKIPKEAWRICLGVAEPMSSSGRTRWQFSHASCYIRNLADGIASQVARITTQSMSYNAMMLDVGWGREPNIDIPDTSDGELVKVAIAAADTNENPSIEDLLPQSSARLCWSSVMTKTVCGINELKPDDGNILRLFFLVKSMTPRITSALNASEAGEADLQADVGDSGPLKNKFTQYSPNSAAHCRDCQRRLEAGDVRVGASVYSSSSRHAGYAVNYWCLECMCKKPAIQRNARLYSGELEKVLPGADLLEDPDVQRVCNLLGIPMPTPEARAAMASSRQRSTRSGRKFGSWGGGPSNDGGSDGNDDTDGPGGSSSMRSKRARR